MIDVPAGECRIYLFEGARDDVQKRANTFLAEQEDNKIVRLVDVLFNFQGNEYDGAKTIPDSSSFGLGLVFQYVFPQHPVDATGRPVAHPVPGGNPAPPSVICALTPEMIFAAASIATRPTTRIGRLWERLAGRIL